MSSASILAAQDDPDYSSETLSAQEFFGNGANRESGLQFLPVSQTPATRN